MLAKFIIGSITLGTSLLAAEVAGTWNLHWKTPDGYQHDSVLTLTESGGKLSGKISSRRGSVNLADGTITGNDVRFTVVRTGNGDEFRIQFTGKLEGETMKLRMEYKDHSPVALTAKRASQTLEGTAK